MKVSKRIISIVLAVVMVASIFAISAVSASAASLKAPKGLKLTNTFAAVQISWNKVSGAKQYQVYCNNKLLTTTAKTTTKNFSVYSGTIYAIKVRAINGSKKSAFTSLKKIMRINPTFIYTKSNVNEGLKITWGVRKGADKYYIERKTTGSYTTIANTKSTSYIDKTAVSGTKYTYRITGYNNATKAYSNPSTMGTYTRLASVSGVKAVNNVVERTVDLSWNAVNGATSYNVYRQKITDKSFKKIGNTTSKAYTDHDMIVNPSAYRYYVTAVKGSDQSASSVERFVHTYGAKNAYFDPENDGGVRNYHVPLEFKVGDVYAEGKGLTDYYSYNGTFDVEIKSGNDVISIDDNVITAKKAGSAQVYIGVTDAVKSIVDDTLKDDLVKLFASRYVILEITVK